MPSPGNDIYVNRKETEAAFFEAIEGAESLIVVDMNARHWMGKTRTLDYLKNQLKEVKRFGAWIGSVDLGTEEFKLPKGDPEEDDKVYEKYVILFLQILANLYNDIFKIAPKKFYQGIENQLLKLAKKVGFGIQIPVTIFNISITKPNLEDGTARERIDKKRDSAIQFFGKKIRAKVKGQGRVFIFLDNFCQIQGTLIERWVLKELLPELTGCKVILGRAECNDLPTHQAEMPKRLEINEFSRTETDDYVRQTLNVEGVTRHSEDGESWSDVIYRITRGNPMLVSWLVHSIKQEKLQFSPADERLIAATLPISRNDVETLDALVERVCKKEPDLGQLINAACILRRFDYETLQFVTVSKIEDRFFEHAWQKFLALPGVSEDEGRVTVNTLLAATREKAQRETHSAYVDSVHQQAAQFYRQRLQDMEDESNLGVWDRFHRYEDPRFQFYNQRWLYHLAALRDKRRFILESAVRYFDAFFWWGDYLHFPFCDQLIADLKGLLVGNENRQTQEWIDLLSEFHENFVPRRERTRNPRWLALCRGQVNAILEQLHADRKKTEEDDQPDFLHLKGLLLSYLAEVDWIESAGDAARAGYARAAANYQQSIECLVRAEKLYTVLAHSLPATEDEERKKLEEFAERETWVIAWMWVWLVNLYAEHGQSDLCLENCLQAEKAVRRADAGDLEALARIHSARAQAHFARQEWQQSLEEFQRYAMDTLGFLCSDYKTGGDLYTVEFYREMVEVIGGSLLELHRRDAGLASVWWDSLYRLWNQASANIMPEPADEYPPQNIAEALTLNPDGYMLDHKLPLPRLFVALDPRTGEKQIVPKYLPKDFKTAYRELRSLL